MASACNPRRTAPPVNRKPAALCGNPIRANTTFGLKPSGKFTNCHPSALHSDGAFYGIAFNRAANRCTGKDKVGLGQDSGSAELEEKRKMQATGEDYSSDGMDDETLIGGSVYGDGRKVEEWNAPSTDNDIPADTLPEVYWRCRGSAPSRGQNASYNGGAKDGLFGRGNRSVPPGLSQKARGGGGIYDDDEVGDGYESSGDGDDGDDNGRDEDAFVEAATHNRDHGPSVFDPDCAVCGAAAPFKCGCESLALYQCIRMAEEHMMANGNMMIRDWVRLHAQDYILKYYEIITDRSKNEHVRDVLWWQENAANSDLYKRDSMAYELGLADEKLKNELDDCWKQSVKLYPEVLDYFYSLVSWKLPENSDPRVVDPSLFPLPGAVKMVKKSTPSTENLATSASNRKQKEAPLEAAVSTHAPVPLCRSQPQTLETNHPLPESIVNPFEAPNNQLRTSYESFTAARERNPFGQHKNSTTIVEPRGMREKIVGQASTGHQYNTGTATNSIEPNKTRKDNSHMYSNNDSNSDSSDEDSSVGTSEERNDEWVSAEAGSASETRVKRRTAPAKLSKSQAQKETKKEVAMTEEAGRGTRDNTLREVEEMGCDDAAPSAVESTTSRHYSEPQLRPVFDQALLENP